MFILWARQLLEGLRAVMTEPQARSHRRRLVRALVLLVVLGTLMMLPIHLTARWMTVAILALLGVGLVAALGSAAFLGRLAQGLAPEQSTDLERSLAAFEAGARVVRRVGVALPALVFFVAWALLFNALWLGDPGACSADPAIPCHYAFHGAGARPVFGDFLYFAINEAFANPPPDLLPASRLARTAATIEVLAGILLVTLYATAFFGLRMTEQRRAAPTEPAPSR